MKMDKWNIKPIISLIYILIAYIIITVTIIYHPCIGWGEELSNQTKTKQNENITSKNSEKILLRVGNETITAADFKEYLSYRPISASSSDTREVLGQRLDEMITSEALRQEALRQNIDQDPKIQRIIYQILTQKLLEEQVERKVWNRQIEDKELQEYYDRHNEEFNRPEKVRLSDIFIAVDPKANSEQRAEKKKKAESVLAEAMNKGKGRYNFGELIKRYSDVHPKYPKGDTTYFDAEGNPLGLDKKLVREAFKLKRIGEICDHIIEAPEGYHIIMLSEKFPAFHKPLEEVKGLIERRIRREELEKKREEFIRQIKEKADIKKNDQAIVEVFEEIKKAYMEEESTKIKKSKSGYRDRHMPPPFPGE